MELWTVGVKVADLQSEIAFLGSLGGELVLDDVVSSGGGHYRAPLMRIGDKFLHLIEKPVYEDRLGSELPAGLVHVVYSVEDLEAARSRVRAAGAQELLPPRSVRAGFGSRDVGCYRSPGGLIFELIKIHDNGTLA
jgi:hypothetical protein